MICRLLPERCHFWSNLKFYSAEAPEEHDIILAFSLSLCFTYQLWSRELVYNKVLVPGLVFCWSEGSIKLKWEIIKWTIFSLFFYFNFFFLQIQSITDSSRGSIRRKNQPGVRSQHSAEEGASLAEKPEDEVMPPWPFSEKYRVYLQYLWALLQLVFKRDLYPYMLSR